MHADGVPHARDIDSSSLEICYLLLWILMPLQGAKNRHGELKHIEPSCWVHAVARTSPQRRLFHRRLFERRKLLPLQATLLQHVRHERRSPRGSGLLERDLGLHPFQILRKHETSHKRSICQPKDTAIAAAEYVPIRRRACSWGPPPVPSASQPPPSSYVAVPVVALQEYTVSVRALCALSAVSRSPGLQFP